MGTKERFGGHAITWLGHSAFRIDTPEGKTVVIDPWILGNPACPESNKAFSRIDLMLVTHGHFDHIADAVELAGKHKPKVVAIYETCHWLDSKGVKDTCPMNKGGTQELCGIRITMVHANHSCGILDGGRILYGGEAAGYVLEFPGGFRLYHAGDTNVFGDMRLIAELYKPDAACLPIGDLYTMSPREAAMAARFLGSKYLIPMHHGTFPPLTGRPEQLKALLKGLPCEVVECKPGQTLR